MKLTWTEVVNRSNMKVPGTASFYRDKFITYFAFINEGRNRRYQESCVDLLNFIHKLYSAGNTYEFVLDALENSYGVPVESGELSVSNSSSIQQPDFISAIRDIFTQELNSRDTTILHLQQELSDIKESLQLLHKEAKDNRRGTLSRDTEIMSMMRDMRDERERARKQRKWWHIFFKK